MWIEVQLTVFVVPWGSVKLLTLAIGVPVLHKRINKATYGYLEDRVRQKLSSWMARNFAGRITLAKSVLTTIPLYAMQS